MKRNSLSEEDALARMRSQKPLSEKCELCDFVIDNNGDISTTKEHVVQIFKKLSSSKKHLIFRTGLLGLALCIFGGILFAIQRQ